MAAKSKAGHLVVKGSVFGMIAALALMASPGLAATCEGLAAGPSGVVRQVTDGDTVVLDSGLEVRLIGMQAPKLPLGRRNFETWPMAEEAKAALERMALDKPVKLGFGGERIDRNGRTLAHMFIDAGDGKELWAQQAMVELGLARVYSFADNRMCLGELLAAEGRARAERRGIWTDAYYFIRDAQRPDQILSRIGDYELVEGRVLKSDEVRGQVFLNFGRRWSEDFTAVISSGGMKVFTAAGIDPLKLEGALIRVRGWVEDEGGPRITITHPEQIEVLGNR